MDKAAAITNIRAQLAKGDIEEALQLLIQQLEPERKQLRELNNRAIQAKAQLEKTQRDELQGVISFENSKLNYNQITQLVIDLVDEWENPSTSVISPRRKITPQMIMVAAVLLIFVGFVAFRMIKRDRRISVKDECPKFEPKSMFNIMVLPFNSLNLNSNAQPLHQQIARRLDRIKDEFSQKVLTSVRDKASPTPQNDEEAISTGEGCAAKLVIWGEFEVKSQSDMMLVTTNYKYLAPDSTFSFAKLSIGEDSAVESGSDASNIPTRGVFNDTITSLTSITAQGTLTDKLEDQLRLLFGVAVMQSGDAAGAIEILKDAEANDSSAALLKDMALAESHLQTGNKEAAKQDYDRVLELHPNYWFALNNRALLYYQEGDYAAALETVERKLEAEPNNVAALTLRGAVRIQTKEFKEAQEDLERADRLNTDQEKQPYIRKKLDLLEEERTIEEKRLDVTKTRLTANRNDMEAMTDLAEIHRNLGNYELADRAASQILDQQPANLRAIAVKVETATKLNKTREATKAIIQVNNLDPATKTTLIQRRAVLGLILEEKEQQ